MTDMIEAGVPYPSDRAAPIDQWSEAVYTALCNWHLAREGEWSRWEPGYLLLTITRAGGGEVEPITLYTAHEELTVEFGGWVTHHPAPYELWDAEADVIAPYAKSLILSWLHGKIRTGVFTTATGKWCGSTLIEAGELEPQLRDAAEEMRHHQPEQLEIRTPAKLGWQSYPIDPNWLNFSVLPPEFSERLGDTGPF